MRVFVVVLEDRHIDPVITVHRTRAAADRKFDEHKASYGDHYQWSPEEHGAADWVRLESTREDCEDGPSCRIERTVMR